MEKRGRPSKYTEAIGAEICRRIASGQGLAQALREMEKDPEFKGSLPSYETVFRWLREDMHEGFRKDYARAREDQADHDADHLRKIAEQLEQVPNRDAAAGLSEAARIYQWLAGKRKPKVYGDLQKLEHSGSDGAPLTVVINRPGGKGDD
jgi:hypothetical protein